jgi:hypothetical protein
VSASLFLDTGFLHQRADRGSCRLELKPCLPSLPLRCLGLPGQARHGGWTTLAVDTNVRVYAADAASQFDWLERERARPVRTPFGRSSASPGLAVLVPTERHADVEEVILELPHLAGNLLHDAHTAILTREHGIGRICARDTDFNQFPFLK